MAAKPTKRGEKKCQKLEATGAQKEEAAKLGEEREIGESVDFGREAPGAVCTGGGICVVVLWQCSFFQGFLFVAKVAIVDGKMKKKWR